MNSRLCLLLVSWAALLSPPRVLAQIRFIEVADGFQQPLYLTHAGDGSQRLFVVERSGRIRIIQDGTTRSTAFLDLSNVVSDSFGEMGLLGLAFHPNYASNGRFFVNYTREDGGSRESVIAEYSVSSGDPNRADTTETIWLTFSQPRTNHNGGWMGFGPDGMLYIATGDGGGAGDPEGSGQRLDTLLGKVLRINVDSGIANHIPSDNPFLGVAGARGEIWATGLRNPWRMSFDRDTGILLAGDVGQNSFEEVDIIQAGRNYGWNRMEGPECYSPPIGCDRSGLTLPIDSYGRTQGASVTGGYVYRGNQFTDLEGHYIFGDFVSGRIWALERRAATIWVRTELLNTSMNISSFGEDESGELYLVDYSGRVLQIDFTQVPPPFSNLAVDLDTNTTAFVGERIQARVSLSNQGSADTAGLVTLTVEIPPGPLVEAVAAPPGWECSANGTVVCATDQALPPGIEQQLSVLALLGPDSIGELTIRAVVDTDDDPIEDNDTDESLIEVESLDSAGITYSQLALGGGFDVLLLVTNTSHQLWSGRAELRQGNANPWTGTWLVNGLDSSGETGFDVDLPANGTQRYLLTGDGVAREGYLRLLPTASSSIQSISSSFFYQLRSSSGLIDSTGTPTDLPGDRFLVTFEKKETAQMGIALAPFRRANFQVHFDFLDAQGASIGTRTVEFEGHSAFLMDEVHNQLPTNFAGSVVIRGEAPLYVTVLRIDVERDNIQLTSLPATRLP